MIWKGCERKRLWRVHYSVFYLEGLRKTTKTPMRMVGVPTEIRTANLPNLKSQCCAEVFLAVGLWDVALLSTVVRIVTVM
jgi:hypothetical protein